MRILHYDLETAPTQAYVWKMWKENISPGQVIADGRVICWAAKWDDEDTILWASEHHHEHEDMIRALHGLQEQADACVTYNGNNFDKPVIQAEYLKYRLAPPAPSKQVDLYQTVKRQFRLAHRRMDTVAKYLGLEGKSETGGFDLWTRCMEGDPAAWEKMVEYNQQDVLVLQSLYHELLPWINSHPSHTLENAFACPKCGSSNMQKRGVAVTAVSRFQRYQCMDCGSWARNRAALISNKPAYVGVVI